MNMQSPTTLLSSIQYMKNKLRNDKQTLMEIKNDFTKFNKKPNPVHQEEQPFVLADISNVQLNKSARNSHSIDHASKSKMLQLKKEHQREILRLKQLHSKQINEILRVKELEMEDMQHQWRQKLEEQVNYIAILEDQVSSPIQTERENVSVEQYDTIINKLLQDNTRIYEENCKYKQQCQKWRRLYNELDSERTNKSRFKFAKIKKEDSKVSHYQSQKSVIAHAHKRVSSIYLYNDENIDRSNIQYDKEWDDIEIHDDEERLKTIRQFSKSILEDQNYRRKGEGYLSVKL